MKTVVTLGQDEALRMLAVVVMQRPENSGRYVGGVEVETAADGSFIGARVMVFDSREEASGWGLGIAAGERPAGTPARVLSIVARPPEVPAS